MGIMKKLEVFLAEKEKSGSRQKAERTRGEEVGLREDIMKCGGKLNKSLNNFKTVIRTQSANIRQGEEEGFDTSIQETELWDAAIGYMLVKDAKFALNSVADRRTVDSAYQMLNQAAMLMSGKRGRVKGKRGQYDYRDLINREAIRDKEDKLDRFFAKLIKTGDIEACLSLARSGDSPDGGGGPGGGDSPGGADSPDSGAAHPAKRDDVRQNMHRIELAEDKEKNRTPSSLPQFDTNVDIHPPHIKDDEMSE